MGGSRSDPLPPLAARWPRSCTGVPSPREPKAATTAHHEALQPTPGQCVLTIGGFRQAHPDHFSELLD